MNNFTWLVIWGINLLFVFFVLRKVEKQREIIDDLETEKALDWPLRGFLKVAFPAGLGDALEKRKEALVTGITQVHVADIGLILGGKASIRIEFEGEK